MVSSKTTTTTIGLLLALVNSMAAIGTTTSATLGTIHQREEQLSGVPVFRACEDFVGANPPFFELKGTAIVEGSISCEVPVVVYIEENVVLLSAGPLQTTGLHLIVLPQARLTLIAPAVEMERIEGTHLPVIVGEGRVHANISGEKTAFIPGSTGCLGKGCIHAEASNWTGQEWMRKVTLEGRTSLTLGHISDEFDVIFEDAEHGRGQDHPSGMPSAVSALPRPCSSGSAVWSHPMGDHMIRQLRLRDTSTGDPERVIPAVETAVGKVQTEPNTDARIVDEVNGLSLSSMDSIERRDKGFLISGRKCDGHRSHNQTAHSTAAVADDIVVEEAAVALQGSPERKPWTLPTTVEYAKRAMVATAAWLRATALKEEGTVASRMKSKEVLLLRWQMPKPTMRQQRIRAKQDNDLEEAHFMKNDYRLGHHRLLSEALHFLVMFGRRRSFSNAKGPSFELWITADGFKVTKPEVSFWGITADAIMD